MKKIFKCMIAENYSFAKFDISRDVIYFSFRKSDKL